MSSESDVDEFYDAQDVTPLRQSRLRSRSSDVETETLSDIEKEEERLIQRRQLVEERRKQEEIDIDKKLAALEEKRQREKEKQEAAQKASDNQVRRKKLEQIRKYLSNENATTQGPIVAEEVPEDEATHSNCRNEDQQIKDNNTGARSQTVDSGAVRLNPDDILEEKLKTLSFELEKSGHLNREDFFRRPQLSNESVMDDSFDNITSSHFISLSKTVHSFDSDCFEDAQDTLTGTSSSAGTHSTKSLNITGQQPINVIKTKPSDFLLVEDDNKLKSSSLPVQLSLCPCTQPGANLTDNTGTILPEPDLIQSTKSLPRQQQPITISLLRQPITSTPKVSKPDFESGAGTNMQPVDGTEVTDPVAPPRKRKSANVQDSDLLADEDLPGPLTNPSIIEPPTSPIQISTVEDLPPGYRPSLDLCAATQGNRHVVATEEAAIKGDDQGLDVLVAMDTVTEETPSNQDNENDDYDIDLDIEVKREDSVPGEDDILTNFENTNKHENTDKLKSRDSFLMKQKSKTLGTSVRTGKRTSSVAGKVLSDKEILEQVVITNLDTGEKVPLGLAEEKLPQSLNPLSLHIMRRTKEFISDHSSAKGVTDAGKDNIDQGKTVNTVKAPKKRGKKIKKFISKSVRKIKSELKSSKEDKNSSSDEDDSSEGRRMIKIKASNSHKGPYDFDLLVPVQNLAEDSGAAVWTMKFSHCGRLLATGGQDNMLRIWLLKTAHTYFDGMRQKYSEAARVSPTPSQDSMQSMDTVAGEIEIKKL